MSEKKKEKGENESESREEITMPQADADYEKAYNELAKEAPPREVETPEDPKSNAHQTLGESIGLSEDLTDLQYAMAKLFPAEIDKNSTMIGRIDPNVLLSMLHLMSVNEIMKADPAKSLDVNSIYMNNYIRLTIGLDGRGRIDTAGLLGAAREERKAERMLGTGGL